MRLARPGAGDPRPSRAARLAREADMTHELATSTYEEVRTGTGGSDLFLRSFRPVRDCPVSRHRFSRAIHHGRCSTRSCCQCRRTRSSPRTPTVTIAWRPLCRVRGNSVMATASMNGRSRRCDLAVCTRSPLVRITSRARAESRGPMSFPRGDVERLNQPHHRHDVRSLAFQRFRHVSRGSDAVNVPAVPVPNPPARR